jgi:hypothetical protein
VATQLYPSRLPSQGCPATPRTNSGVFKG